MGSGCFLLIQLSGLLSSLFFLSSDSEQFLFRSLDGRKLVSLLKSFRGSLWEIAHGKSGFLNLLLFWFLSFLWSLFGDFVNGALAVFSRRLFRLLMAFVLFRLLVSLNGLSNVIIFCRSNIYWWLSGCDWDIDFGFTNIRFIFIFIILYLFFHYVGWSLILIWLLRDIFFSKRDLSRVHNLVLCVIGKVNAFGRRGGPFKSWSSGLIGLPINWLCPFWVFSQITAWLSAANALAMLW